MDRWNLWEWADDAMIGQRWIVTVVTPFFYRPSGQHPEFTM
jgi:hypothetical protein